MLWIFDEEQQAGKVPIFSSMARCHRCAALQAIKRCGSVIHASRTIIRNSGIGMVRLLQSGLSCLLIVLSFNQLTKHANFFSPSGKVVKPNVVLHDHSANAIAL
jgi:hypothetical protein